MQSRPYQFWVSAEGIAREVITADIQRYLGPDALVRPGRGAGENEDQDGFWVTAHTTLTRQMLQDLKADSQRWRQEAGQQRHGTRGFEYQDSRTHAARQQYGPSPPPSLPPNIATTALGSFSPQPQQNFEQRGTFAGRASLSQDTKPTSPSQDYYTASDGRRYPITSQSPFGQSATPRQSQNTISKDSETSTPSPGYYIASDGRQYPVAKQPSQSQHSRQPESAPPKQTSSRPGYYLASDGREYPLPQASTQRQAPAPSQETKSTTTPGYYVASDGRQYPLAQQPGYSQSQANYQTQTTVPKPSSPTSFTSAYYTASDGRQYPRSQQPQQSGYGLRSPLPNTSGFGGGAGAGGGADSDNDVKKGSDKRRRRSSRDYDM